MSESFGGRRTIRPSRGMQSRIKVRPSLFLWENAAPIRVQYPFSNFSESFTLKATYCGWVVSFDNLSLLSVFRTATIAAFRNNPGAYFSGQESTETRKVHWCENRVAG